jgi:hypothetical protein
MWPPGKDAGSQPAISQLAICGEKTSPKVGLVVAYKLMAISLKAACSKLAVPLKPLVQDTALCRCLISSACAGVGQLQRQQGEQPWLHMWRVASAAQLSRP